MANVFSKSLTNKLIVLFLVVSLVPIAIVGYFSYSSGRSSMKNQFLNNLKNIAQSREIAIIIYLKAKAGRCLDFSSDGYIRDNLEKINQKGADLSQLSEKLSEHLEVNKKPLDPGIYETLVLDLEGNVAASSNEREVGEDHSDEDYFIEGKKGVYIKDVHHTEGEGKDFITVSAPLHTRQTKELIGVIVNHYETKVLNEITTDRTGMGETGEVYIVNKDGYMITESRFMNDVVLKQKVDTEPVRLFQNQGKIMTGIYPDYRGLPIVGASMGDDIDKEFGLGWTILAEMDVAEAFAPVYALGLRTIWISIPITISVIIIAYFMSRGIAKPIKRITDQVVKVGEGDLTVDVSYDNRADEVGVLAQTFSMMVKNLRSLTLQIQEGANVLVTTTGQLATSVTQIAAGSVETATAVSETTTTAEEVKQTAQVASEKARHVSENAQKAAQVSQSGKKSTEDNIEGMNHIREQMESIAESVVSLSEQSRSIGEIIETVNDLAEQSNLLAVNASIEAAKAGEEGKGFTVVAQEVKSLAEQSRQATAQVRGILNDIQRATSAAVMATEQGSKAVEAGVEQSARAGESILALANSITESAQSAVQIMASSRQELVGMDQVVTAMDNIRLASDQNVESTKQLETAGRDLQELGQKLKDLAGRYKV